VVVLIGNSASDLSRRLVAEFPDIRAVEWADARSYDWRAGRTGARQLVLIEDLGMDREDLLCVLAGLRDTVSGQLILWSPRLDLTTALALGFRRLRQTAGLYGFDLFDYKQTPDWFNADYFAHPERWGKFR
jgi:hypothetical protein